MFLVNRYQRSTTQKPSHNPHKTPRNTEEGLLFLVSTAADIPYQPAGTGALSLVGFYFVFPFLHLLPANRKNVLHEQVKHPNLLLFHRRHLINFSLCAPPGNTAFTCCHTLPVPASQLISCTSCFHRISVSCLCLCWTPLK